MPDPAYDEGWDACHEGKPETANPYDPNDAPEDHTAWNDGWIAAFGGDEFPEDEDEDDE